MDTNNRVEVGAFKDFTPDGVFGICPHRRDTLFWWRFWYTRNAGMKHCTAEKDIITQPDNSWHQVDVSRDPAGTRHWRVGWDGILWTTVMTQRSAGYPLASTERNDNQPNDSMYAEFDGADYQTTEPNWYAWSGVEVACDNDPAYNLHDPVALGSDGSHFKMNKPNSPSPC
jgi:hypothetical protein